MRPPDRSPPLAVVAEATHRHRGRTATASDLDVLERVALRPLAGGMNNALYRLRHDGRDLCLKLHRVDSRRRAHREWPALTLLAGRTLPDRSGAATGRTTRRSP